MSYFNNKRTKEMNEKTLKKNKYKQRNELSYITRVTTPGSNSPLEKCARTPFERIRRKEKMRKERIHLSLTPTKQDLSLIIGRQSTSFYGSARKSKQCRSDRSSISPSHLRTGKEGNYRIVVRDSSKKRSCRESPLQKAEEPERRLVVEGANCGSDLIALNRHKLEQMIAQIKANNAALHEKYDISEVVLEKGKFTRSRQFQKRSSRQEGGPILSSECRQKAIDSREFLICSPAVVETARNDLSIEGSSALFDGFNKWERVFALSPKHPSRKTCKTEELSKSQSPRNFRKPSPGKKGPIFNGFNLHNLKGWESTEETEETFFQLALR